MVAFISPKGGRAVPPLNPRTVDFLPLNFQSNQGSLHSHCDVAPNPKRTRHILQDPVPKENILKHLLDAPRLDG